MTHRPARFRRDYAPLREFAERLAGDRTERMHALADALWDTFHGQGVSWIGFYIKTPGADEMILGPGRDTPACSPIGLHGACGRSWSEQAALVVPDVANLGEGYIACDPRDRSEVVVPLFDDGGSCWGVLDADSHETEAFDETDARELAELMVHAGLSAHAPETIVRI